MKTYTVTITDGERTDRFSFQSESLRKARRTAEIAHLGSGWSVKSISADKPRLVMDIKK